MRCLGSRSGAVIGGSVRKEIWLGLVLATLLLFHGCTLMRFPQVFVDEAWYGARALGYLRTGQAYGSLDSDFMVHYPGYGTYFPLLPVVLHAISFRLAGQPSLLAMRIVSLVFGFWLLLAVYSTAYRLRGWRVAVLSVTLVGFSWPFCISAHWARTDVMASALGYTAIALYVNNRRRRFLLDMLAGLCVGIGVEFHPNAVIFGPALAVVCLGALSPEARRKSSLGALILGGVAGVVLYALLHIVRHPETYFELNRLLFSATHTPPLFTLDIEVIAEAFRHMVVSMLLEVYPKSILLVVAVASLLQQSSRGARSLAILATVLALSYTLFVRNKVPYYAILATPAFDIAVAGLVADELSRQWRRRVIDYARRALILGLCLASVVRAVGSSIYPYHRDYQETLARIDAVVSPGENILGPQTYWFGLYEHDYDSWEEIVYYQRYSQGDSLDQALGTLHPDVLIVDGYVRIVSDDERLTMYDQYVSLDLDQLKSFVSAHGSLLTHFDGGVYGEVSVYHIEWE